MSLKIISYILVIITVFVSTNLVGTEANSSHIDAQIENIQRFAVSRTGQKVSLLLGAVNTRSHVDDSWVFFDNESQDSAQHNPAGKPYIKGDFNDLTLLEKLANSLESCFDKILVDDSTFKFTAWNIRHLSYFSKMLKPGGDFVFRTNPNVNKVVMQESQYKELTDHFKERVIRLKTDDANEDDYLQSYGLRLFRDTSDQYYQECILPYNEALLSKVFPEVALEKMKGFPIPSSFTASTTEVDMFVCKKVRNSLISEEESDIEAKKLATKTSTIEINPEEDRVISTARILGKLSLIEFSAKHGTCEQVLNELEKSIAQTIFDGSTQSWVYKGNIFGTVGVSGFDMLDDYKPLLTVSFGKIAERVKATTNDLEVIGALHNLCKVYKHIRGWMEAIWNDRDPRSFVEPIITKMREAYLQSEQLQRILDIAPDKVERAYQTHLKKFHPSFLNGRSY